MRVLVTRPEPQASATAAVLAARGHTAHCAPLATIEPVAAELPAAGSVDAILLTSGNAVGALDRYRHLPVYAVGEATAAAARAAGARQVAASGGDWQALAALLRGPAGPPAGSRLLHLAGAEQRGDLAGACRAAGFACARRIVYTVRPRQFLAATTLALLDQGTLDAVLFFSPAHAAIWRRLVARAAVCERLFALRAICLSPAVAQPLIDLPWRQLAIADAPALPRLIDRLEAPERRW